MAEDPQQARAYKWAGGVVTAICAVAILVFLAKYGPFSQPDPQENQKSSSSSQISAEIAPGKWLGFVNRESCENNIVRQSFEQLPRFRITDPTDRGATQSESASAAPVQHKLDFIEMGHLSDLSKSCLFSGGDHVYVVATGDSVVQVGVPGTPLLYWIEKEAVLSD